MGDAHVEYGYIPLGTILTVTNEHLGSHTCKKRKGPVGHAALGLGRLSIKSSKATSYLVLTWYIPKYNQGTYLEEKEEAGLSCVHPWKTLARLVWPHPTFLSDITKEHTWGEKKGPFAHAAMGDCQVEYGYILLGTFLSVTNEHLETYTFKRKKGAVCSCDHSWEILTSSMATSHLVHS